MNKLSADYLVIGSGAVSMTFVDTMLDESDATFIIVDHHHLPGGHWNDAYPFVRLHQPSASYGVASRRLGSDRIDESGSNKGYMELASGAEVSAYFEQIMRERFLPSGRVQYFPMCDYKGDGKFTSLLSGKQFEVAIEKKTVDGTFFQTSVPSTHKRKYETGENVVCITPNELPRRASEFRHFTVVGAGKTGMDALVWLLDNGADPDKMRWICPRDSWLINRETTQPSAEFFEQAIGGFAHQLEAFAAASSVDDAFARLEDTAQMLRIDKSVWPTMCHYATISHGEIEQLRRIKNVLRQGRVSRIDENEITFTSSETAAAKPGTLYIDCTATAVAFSRESRPIYEQDRITIQPVRSPLVTLSAAIIAYVEARFETDAQKNQMCTPVVLADTPAEYMVSFLGNMMNQNAWSQDDAVNKWVGTCRLNAFGKIVREADRSDPAKMKILARIKENAMPAAMNLQKLINEDAA
ncbi:MAG: hypothetical protein KJN99_07870 [Marinicaulis sp.]|nr:hypothetical protein [Marinicaulis sp.]